MYERKYTLLTKPDNILITFNNKKSFMTYVNTGIEHETTHKKYKHSKILNINLKKKNIDAVLYCYLMYKHVMVNNKPIHIKEQHLIVMQNNHQGAAYKNKFGDMLHYPVVSASDTHVFMQQLHDYFKVVIDTHKIHVIDTPTITIGEEKESAYGIDYISNTFAISSVDQIVEYDEDLDFAIYIEVKSTTYRTFVYIHSIYLPKQLRNQRIMSGMMSIIATFMSTFQLGNIIGISDASANGETEKAVSRVHLWGDPFMDDRYHL